LLTLGANRLPGTPLSVQFGELGEAFLALERSETDNYSPKVRKLGISNNFANPLEKFLPKGENLCLLNIGHFGCGSVPVVGVFSCCRIITKCPCFKQYQFPKTGGVYSLNLNFAFVLWQPQESS